MAVPPQAMAAGLPVIAVAAGGLLDIMTQPGVTGDTPQNTARSTGIGPGRHEAYEASARQCRHDMWAISGLVAALWRNHAPLANLSFAHGSC